MPGEQPPLQSVDLYDQPAQLIAQDQQSRAGGFRQRRHTTGARLSQEIEHPARSLRRHEAELGAVTPDRVDQLGPLAHQQFAGPMEH